MQKVIALALLLVITPACVKKNRAIPLHKQCSDGIREVTELHSKNSSDGKSVAQQALNLITAAKIQQQHEQYAQCIDSITRARVLLENNAAD